MRANITSTGNDMIAKSGNRHTEMMVVEVVSDILRPHWQQVSLVGIVQSGAVHGTSCGDMSYGTPGQTHWQLFRSGFALLLAAMFHWPSRIILSKNEVCTRHNSIKP